MYSETSICHSLMYCFLGSIIEFLCSLNKSDLNYGPTSIVFPYLSSFSRPMMKMNRSFTVCNVLNSFYPTIFAFRINHIGSPESSYSE
jgi:hypothetical protein